jgi:hypothetical protein
MLLLTILKGEPWTARGGHSMSEHRLTLVRLDVLSASKAESIADQVRDWLLAREVIAPNDRHHELWQPSAWMPGTGARAVVADVSWYEAFLDTANNGVDINAESQCYHPVDDEVPHCPSCSAAVPDSYFLDYDAWLERWMRERHEPSFTCGSCGKTTKAGDWVGDFCVAVGAPAVTFNNWPHLDGDFMTEVLRQLGGRARVVRAHM